MESIQTVIAPSVTANVTEFDKGVQFAINQIAHILEVDRDVRVSRSWALDYDTLHSNVMVFIYGQKNRLSGSPGRQ